VGQLVTDFVKRRGEHQFISATSNHLLRGFRGVHDICSLWLVIIY